MFQKKNKVKYERGEFQKQALQLLKKKNYTFIKRLGCGTFGDVIAIRKNDSVTIAAKIVHKINTSPGEIYLWPCLRHPNVLPLLERFHYKNLDIFLIPLMPDTLSNISKEEKFRKNTDLFEMTVGWMKDMFSGLEYLHSYGVCHLDIKEDNILISPGLRAIISDFSGITETKQPVKRCLLPKCYSPPETWIKGQKLNQLSADGEKIDIWGAGLVVFYYFSNRWVEKKQARMSLTQKILFETKKWMSDIYPSIFKCLQEPFFSTLMKSAHPACEITQEDCTMTLNLLRGILRYSPEKRPSATDVLEHPLFSTKSRKCNLLEPDEIWITKKSDSYEPKDLDEKTVIGQLSGIQFVKVTERTEQVT